MENLLTALSALPSQAALTAHLASSGTSHIAGSFLWVWLCWCLQLSAVGCYLDRIKACHMPMWPFLDLLPRRDITFSYANLKT